MMKVAAVHQPQYLPYLGFFHKTAQADVLVLMDNVQFQRRGVQNRNKIKTAAGPKWLTVPVLQRWGQLINEVRTNPTVEWQSQHVNALRHSYARAKHFATYHPQIQAVLEREWTYLCDVDVALTHWAMEALHIDTPIVLLSELGVAGTSSELLVGACKAVGADHYVSGPGGRRYMDLDVFRDAGVGVIWQDYTSPVYEQVFPEAGFVPDLSVADALFCSGTAARTFVEARDAVG
jgi:hypothetical protein